MNLITEWQTERSRVNHDWLKNNLINKLNSLAALPDDEHTRAITADSLAQWDEQIGKLQSLINHLEHDMSPARLFEAPPLDRVGDRHKSWMLSLLHDHWCRKNDIPGIKAEMSAGLEAVKQAFALFGPKFASGDFSSEDVVRFVGACQKYSEYLSSLRELSVLP